MASKSEDIVHTDYEYDTDETVKNTLSEDNVLTDEYDTDETVKNTLSEDNVLTDEYDSDETVINTIDISDEEERKLTEVCLPDVDRTFVDSLKLNKPDVVIPGMIEYLCSNNLGEAGTIMKLL